MPIDSFRHNIHGGSLPIILQPFEYQIGIHRIPTCNLRNRNTSRRRLKTD